MTNIKIGNYRYRILALVFNHQLFRQKYNWSNGAHSSEAV